MNSHWDFFPRRRLSRREILRRGSAGFGGLALAALLSEEAGAAIGDTLNRSNPLAPKAPHFPARAKRVIFLFMH